MALSGLRIDPAVVIIAFKKGEPSLVLRVTHGMEAEELTGGVSVPAGRIRVNVGETPRAAAIREFQEETGLLTREESLIEIGHIDGIEITRKDGKRLASSVTIFLAQDYEGNIRAGNGETTPEWVSIKSIMEDEPAVGKPLVEGTREVLRMAMDYSIINKERER